MKLYSVSLSVLSGFLVSGFVVFAPKFVESQFGITAAWAAQLIGTLSSVSDLITTLLFCVSPAVCAALTLYDVGAVVA